MGLATRQLRIALLKRGLPLRGRPCVSKVNMTLTASDGLLEAEQSFKHVSSGWLTKKTESWIATILLYR